MISVIIPVWKRYQQLSLILEKLNTQASKKELFIEILLCDSHSGEEMNSLIRNLTPTLKNLSILHLHTKNIVAAKRNLGIKYASGDYLIFLDDDCIPGDNFLTSIINTIKNLAPRTVYCGEVRFEPNYVNKSNYYRYRDSRHPKYDPTKDVFLNAWTFVSMNNLIPKELLIDKSIRYNEEFLGYGCEDHEFPWQLLKTDIKISLSEQLIYHHEYNGNIEKYSNKIKCTARDGMLVLGKLAPDLMYTNKKLMILEKIFKKKGFFNSLLCKILFPNFFLKITIKFLIKTDHVRLLYLPFLYRYVLLSAYIQGLLERDLVNRDELEKDWYI